MAKCNIFDSHTESNMLLYIEQYIKFQQMYLSYDLALLKIIYMLMKMPWLYVKAILISVKNKNYVCFNWYFKKIKPKWIATRARDKQFCFYYTLVRMHMTSREYFVFVCKAIFISCCNSLTIWYDREYKRNYFHDVSISFLFYVQKILLKSV